MKLYKKDDYIYFGSYPQSKVIDETLITELKKNINIECDFGYKDIEYNNELYRYTQNNFYKFEPIKWKIINKIDDSVILLSDLVIDACQYSYHSDTRYLSPNYEKIDKRDLDYILECDDIHSYICIEPNNYEFSEIRKWLNDTFYNTAFNTEQKNILLEMYIDSSEEPSIIHQEKTSDKVIRPLIDKIGILSLSEATNEYFAYDCNTRIKKPTDYAKSQNALPSTSWWWLCTPSDCGDDQVNIVSRTGSLSSMDVTYDYGGVVPVICIKL